MTKAELYKELLRLDDNDRSVVVTMLRATLSPAVDEELPLYEWQREAIKEARDAYDRNPEAVVDAAEAIASLRAKYGA